jgi:hypothetical protein
MELAQSKLLPDDVPDEPEEEVTPPVTIDPPPAGNLPGPVLSLLSQTPGYVEFSAAVDPAASYISIQVRHEDDAAQPTSISWAPVGNGTYSAQCGYEAGTVLRYSAAQAATQNNQLAYGPELEVTVPMV